MKKYYNNIECNVIADLPNGQVAITFITGLFYDYDTEFGNNSEPIESTLVVNKNQLTDFPITKDDIVKQKEEMLKEIEQIKRKTLNDANSIIRQEYSDLQLKVKEIKKQIESLYASSLYATTAQKLKDNLFKYVVSANGFIDKFEEWKGLVLKDAFNENIEYENFYIRVFDNELKYGSYSWQNVKLFENLQDAKKYAETIISKRNGYGISDLDNIDKWNLFVPNAEKQREDIIKKHNISFNQSIENYLKNIESLKKQLREESPKGSDNV